MATAPFEKKRNPMTEKLYDLDGTVTDFGCKVVDLYEESGRLAVVLDRTAFFPTGGGQTCDRGTLAGTDVENVELRGETILHFVENSEENVKKFQKGVAIRGKVDWNKRFSDMQQHSGEHILSGIVHNRFGFNNVGFHLSESGVTVDFDGIFSENDLCKVEVLVNEVVWKNVEIRVWYPDETALQTLVYRSKKEIDGPLRIVEIPGVDVCACCAPHVGRTGEIGQFRILSAEKHRGGTRLSILCGARALQDGRIKLQENAAVSRMLSCKQNDTASHVQKLKSEKEALAFRLVGLQRKVLAQQAAAATPQKRMVEFLDADMETLRFYADLLADKASEFAAVFGEGTPRQFVILSKTGFDVNALCAALRKAFAAKGGGRDGIVQGSVDADAEALRRAIDAARDV